jgi:HlyD family secretion protein
VIRIRALLEQAKHTEKRGLDTRAINKGAISETDLDQCVTDRKSFEAQLDLAQAVVLESRADLDVAKTNLDFTVIQSPVDGIVIDRKVDPGQTVASQFQTPTLFIVAPDLEKKVYVWASVDEADIGQIREAQARNEPVTFTVDAYPNDSFEGRIAQVRLNPTTVQNVVTYTVIVASPNHKLKLLPGMTANLVFQIEKHTGVLAIPNAALRFSPTATQVRPEDRGLVEGEADEGQSGDEAAAGVSARAANRRHVWIPDGDLLRAVEIVIGLSDKSHTEVVSGGLKEGEEVAIGQQTTAAKRSIMPPPPPPH